MSDVHRTSNRTENPDPPPSRDRAKVLVRPCNETTAGVVVGRLLDDLDVDPAGKTVLVKPNMVGPFAPERHATTSPAVVAATVSALRKRGAADIVVGDNPGREAYGAVMHAARVSGLLEAGDGCFRNIASPVETLESVCAIAPHVTVSRAVLEADLLISLPKFKTHLLTMLTGAVKNSYGHLVGGGKALLHRRSGSVECFSEALVDLYAIRPPDLCIIDGIVAMQGDGPTGSDLLRLDRLIASTDGVAADAVMARLMGFDPAQIDHLRVAAERGLGVIAADSMDLEGDATPIEGFRLPCTYRRRRWLSFLIHNVLFGGIVARAKFHINDRCTACGTCVESCPVDAVVLKRRGRTMRPATDYDRCIRCYCCHELCPEDAMELTSPLGRWVFRHFER